MERKTLEEMGLEKDQINTIMSDFGKAVNGLKEQVDTLTAERDSFKKQVNESNKQLDEMKANIKDNDELKSQIADLQGELKESQENAKAELLSVKKNNAINNALREAHVRDNKAIMPFLNTDEIKFNDDGLTGLKGQIEELQKNKSFLFEQPEPPKEPEEPQGIKATAGKVSKGDDGKPTPIDVKNMSYGELLKLKETNPERYQQAIKELI